MFTKIFGAVIMFASIYGGIYLLDFAGILDIPSGQYTATAKKSIQKEQDQTEIREITLKKPIEVEWDGNIFAVLQSGNGYGIKSLDEKAEYPQFMAFWAGDKMEWIEGDVKIRGTLKGIDCAYQNTVFGGKCVPLVIIKTIKKIGDNK